MPALYVENVPEELYEALRAPEGEPDFHLLRSGCLTFSACADRKTTCGPPRILPTGA